MDRQSRKAALLQEFEREIAPARMRLAAQLPGLWQQTYGYAAQSQAAAIAATGIAKAGSKRVSGAGGAGAEFKRPRTEEMERRMEPLFKECQKIIKKLHNIQVLWATWNVPCRVSCMTSSQAAARHRHFCFSRQKMLSQTACAPARAGWWTQAVHVTDDELSLVCCAAPSWCQPG